MHWDVSCVLTGAGARARARPGLGREAVVMVHAGFHRAGSYQAEL